MFGPVCLTDYLLTVYLLVVYPAGKHLCWAAAKCVAFKRRFLFLKLFRVCFFLSWRGSGTHVAEPFNDGGAIGPRHVAHVDRPVAIGEQMVGLVCLLGSRGLVSLFVWK